MMDFENYWDSFNICGLAGGNCSRCLVLLEMEWFGNKETQVSDKGISHYQIFQSKLEVKLNSWRVILIHRCFSEKYEKLRYAHYTFIRSWCIKGMCNMIQHLYIYNHIQFANFSILCYCYNDMMSQNKW